MMLSRRRLLQVSSSLLLLPLRGLAASALARDRRGRLIAPVNINGRGPFRFAIDTGANLSVISDELAADLRLPGAANTPPGNRVVIEQLSADGLASGERRLGLASTERLAGVDGLLGADCLQAHCLDIHIRSGELRIFAGADRAVAPGGGGSPVAAQRRFGSLLALSATIGRVALPAILDTGGQRSVGNLALRKALALRPTGQADSAAVLTDIDGSSSPAEIIATPSLRLGRVGLPAADILYADLPVFGHWGYAQRPAMLLGMDLLGQLGRVFVDYRRTRVLIWP